MTIKGGTTQACAVCKYQRRRCSSDCPLAPYFPANQPKMFQNVHRLYGVSNIMDILKQLDDDNAQKEEAMKSIIYESDMREKFPVHGCLGIICQLDYRLKLAIEELQYVYAQIAICREKCLGQIPSSELQLGLNPSSTDVPVSFQHYFSGNKKPFGMDDFVTNENSAVYIESGDNIPKSFLVLDPFYEGMAHNYLATFQDDDQMVASHGFCVQHETRVFDQDYVVMPVDAFVDDRQSYIESKVPYDSSSGSSSKDTTQSSMIFENASNSELRHAAACFSLTSCVN